MLKRMFVVSSVSTLLVACGSSDSPTLVVEPPPQAITEVPELNGAQSLAGGLVQPGTQRFATYLKNGVFTGNAGEGQVDIMPLESADSAAGSGDRGGFSQTNTAEQGVDEADRIEYDGDYLFVAAPSTWNGESMSEPRVRVLKRESDFALSEVNSLALNKENDNINGMYLSDNHLSVLSSGYPIMPLFEIASTSLIRPGGGFSNTVDVQIFDTQTPESAEQSFSASIDGYLVSSRRIDEQLYIVSSYNPYVELPHPVPESEEQELENYQYLQDQPVTDLMPTISIDGVSSTLNNPEDCYIPEQATEVDGYSSLLTVTRINIAQPDDMQSICLSAYADASYMSTDSLYLSADVNEALVVHKIDIAEQFDYVASGEVKGNLRGRDGTPQLRMNESGDYFRVITSQWSSGEPEHRLTVLQQDGNELELVATLPNDDQPAAIGKPNEDIFAVRFFDDRAYVVTFERIDPLYVIDLSDNTSPFIAGELEIPGFSSYLQPMQNGYLLGVGQEVANPDSTDLVASSEFVATADILPVPVTTGVKLSLFDVSDPANPIEVSNVSFDDTYTPVEYDYRSLSILKSGAQYQFAMPLEKWVEVEGEFVPATDPDDSSSSSPGAPQDEGESSGSSASSEPEDENEAEILPVTYWQAQNSLLLFEVNAQASAGELTVVNEMIIDNPETNYTWSGNDRSVIDGENVYYVHGNLVWQSTWSMGAQINGPY